MCWLHVWGRIWSKFTQAPPTPRCYYCSVHTIFRKLLSRFSEWKCFISMMFLFKSTFGDNIFNFYQGVLFNSNIIKRTWINIDISKHKWRTRNSISSSNSSPPVQNGRHFVDDIFRCIFVNEKFCDLIESTLKIVHKGPVDNNTALVQTMAWHQISDRPLSEPMLTRFTDSYMWHWGRWFDKCVYMQPCCFIAHDVYGEVSGIVWYKRKIN